MEGKLSLFFYFILFLPSPQLLGSHLSYLETSFIYLGKGTGWTLVAVFHKFAVL